MKNVNVSVSEDGILTLKVNLKDSQGMSKSGKSEIFGTTSGNTELADQGWPGFFVGMNVYKTSPKTGD